MSLLAQRGSVQTSYNGWVGQTSPDRLDAGIIQAPATAEVVKRSESEELPFATKSLELKAISEQTRTADFVASTGIVDSHGEIVDQASWRLADYLANPVVLFGHMSHELPIGKAIDVAVRNGRLECRVEFATEAMNPMAEQCWQMVKSGFLRATSVGFMPMTGRYETRNGEEIWVWSDCVLKEISVVPVPANPECLARMKAKILASGAGGSSVLLLREGDGMDDHIVRVGGVEIKINKSPPAALPGHQTAERKEEDMDIKELQAKIAQLEGVIGTKDAAYETVVADFKSARKSNEDLTAKVAALETEKSALEEAKKNITEQRDAEKKARETLEAKQIEAEVDALVGKKIKPTQKATFLKLRTSNPELYAETVATLDEMKLLEQVVPLEKAGNSDLDEFMKA